MKAIVKYVAVGILALMPGERADMQIEINQVDSVPYGNNGRVMMICYPKNALNANGTLANSYPALVLLHQGGWTGGTRFGLTQQAREIAKQGVVVGVPEYPLASAETEPALSVIMADITDAITKLGSFSCTAGQPMSLGGISAGGHLALVYAATQTHALHAVVAVNAPTDLRSWETMLDIAGNPALEYLLGTGYSEATLHAASPMHMSLAGLTVPVILVRGGADVCGDSTEMLPLYQRLASAGKSVRLVRFEGGDHMLSNAIPEFAGAMYPFLQ